MAIFALTSEVVTINAVDYAAYCKSATLALDAAQLDATDMASAGWTESLGGLKSGTLSIELMDDFAAGEVDADLYALLGTVVAFTIKPTSAAPSAANPNYTGSVLVTGHSLGGSVGELATKSLTFPTTGAITRAV